MREQEAVQCWRYGVLEGVGRDVEFRRLMRVDLIDYVLLERRDRIKVDERQLLIRGINNRAIRRGQRHVAHCTVHGGVKAGGLQQLEIAGDFKNIDVAVCAGAETAAGNRALVDVAVDAERTAGTTDGTTAGVNDNLPAANKRGPAGPRHAVRRHNVYC